MRRRDIIIPTGTPARGRGGPSSRQLLLLRALLVSREWLTVAELTEQMYGDALRTAYRDLDLLMALGIPIEQRRADGPSMPNEYRLRRAAFLRWLEGPDVGKAPTQKAP